MIIIGCSIAGFLIGMLLGFVCGGMVNQSVSDIIADREWREGHPNDNTR